MNQPTNAALNRFLAVLTIWGALAACGVGILYGLVQLLEGRVFALAVYGVAPSVLVWAMRQAAQEYRDQAQAIQHQTREDDTDQAQGLPVERDSADDYDEGAPPPTNPIT